MVFSENLSTGMHNERKRGRTFAGLPRKKDTTCGSGRLGRKVLRRRGKKKSVTERETNSHGWVFSNLHEGVRN